MRISKIENTYEGQDYSYGYENPNFSGFRAQKPSSQLNCSLQSSLAKFKELRINLVSQEKVYQCKEYLKLFYSENKIAEFEKTHTAKIKFFSKTQSKNLNYLKRLNFFVEQENEDLQTMKFIQAYSENNILNPKKIKRAYQDFFEKSNKVLINTNSELTSLVIQQFLYFLMSNYKLLQYSQACQLTSQKKNHENDFIDTFKKSKTLKLPSQDEIFKENKKMVLEFNKTQMFNKDTSLISMLGAIKIKGPEEEERKESSSLIEISKEQKVTGSEIKLKHANLRKSSISQNTFQIKNEDHEVNVMLIKEDSRNSSNDMLKIFGSEKSKRTNNFYNMPRYFMMLIIQLLSQNHLELLDLPQALISQIQKIRYNLKKSCLKNRFTKSCFYNHTHYNCLFFIHHNGAVASKSQEQLIKQVFEIDDITSQFNITTINSLKFIMSIAIKQQLEMILNYPLTSYILENHKEYQQEKTKVDYLKRVLIGISKLNEGNSLSRF